MSERSIEIPCPNCGAYMKQERVFCLRCGHRLIPITPYDLVPEDFMYPPDREGLDSLRRFAVLTPIIKEFVTNKYIRNVVPWLSRRAAKVDFSSDVGSTIMECGIILGLKALPRTYIIPDERINAFTFGSDDVQFLVLTSGLLKSLNGEELKAVVAHELGHIRCDHIVYHTLAEMLMRGVEVSSSIMGIGLEALSPLFRLILLSWHRESEVSADRASLLAVGDLDVVKSMFAKLSLNLTGKGKSMDSPQENLISSLSEIFSTHPTLANRTKLLTEFYRSPEYVKARKKIATRLKFVKALVPRCRFCGATKPITDLFCPACGRSLL